MEKTVRPAPPQVETCKAIDAFHVGLLDQVLQNNARIGCVTIVCAVVIAAVLLAGGIDVNTYPSVALCAVLAVLVGIFGVVIVTGALRVKNIIQASPEVQCPVAMLVPNPDHQKAE